MMFVDTMRLLMWWTDTSGKLPIKQTVILVYKVDLQEHNHIKKLTYSLVTLLKSSLGPILIKVLVFQWLVAESLT